MPFVGHFEHLIDEKNRLSIPANFRNEMDPERDGKRFYVLPGTRPHSLRLFTEIYFNRESKQLNPGLLGGDAEADFARAIFSMAHIVEMDGAGRIVLPVWHLQKAEIGREVTLYGAGDCIEIVAREEFNQRKDEMWRNFAEIQRNAREALNQKGGNPA